jgi:hypothetical protein
LHDIADREELPQFVGEIGMLFSDRAPIDGLARLLPLRGSLKQQRQAFIAVVEHGLIVTKETSASSWEKVH